MTANSANSDNISYEQYVQALVNPRQRFLNPRLMSSESNNNLILVSDLLNFVKKAYKSVLLFTIFGLALSTAYYFVTPVDYMTKAVISMPAFIAETNSSPYLIEEPVRAVARLESTPVDNIDGLDRACGWAPEYRGVVLAEKAKLATMKDMPGAMSLQIRANSIEVGEACIMKILEYLQLSQVAMINSNLEMLRDDLRRERELEHAFIGAAKSSKFAEMFNKGFGVENYISILRNIGKIETSINRSKNTTSQLVTAINFSIRRPNLIFLSLLGLLGGVVCGLIFEIGKGELIEMKKID
ncbi:hypothetical protein [Polynucleobacter sp. JS-JIR-5-A7]|uniref:hypothetical protein n=1 Tax=Polynucleobacter sp. JS-JIR-5-A7 TaxID=1758395 RepID=UPI001BFE7289|nr:hypothetical protein [Polynucleobacter sp. JS-JIR-5-A7]QWE06926.1 hypothetical protein AOC29_01610 [Polynucleobacter sp. JS-JIR-5-A7]